MKILHKLGFHNYLNCFRTGELEVRSDDPWGISSILYYEYKCQDCGRTFWKPPGDFQDLQQSQLEYDMKTECADIARRNGDYKKAIEILKV